MRLVLPAIAVLAACGSSGGHGRPGGGLGGHPAGMAGISADAQDADADGLALADGGANDGADDGADDASVDAAPTLSCQLGGDTGGPPACLELDPGYPDPTARCAASGGGPVVDAPCPRDASAGGCHQAETATSGYTIWWYAPLGVGTVLTMCEQMGASYLSP